MFYPPKMYLQDKYIVSALGVNIVLLALSWWGVVNHFRPSEEAVFLHYNIIFGIDMVGEWWKGWYIPVFGSGIFLLNFLLSYALYQRSKFLGRWCLGFTAALCAIVYTGLSFIIGLNS